MSMDMGADYNMEAGSPRPARDTERDSTRGTLSGKTSRIQDLAPTDRPRERLIAEGAGALSTPELLAILLRVGVRGESAVRLAERLLAQVGGLAGLHRAGHADLQALRGVGSAKAAQLLAAVELGSRIARAGQGERPTIRSAADVHALVGYELMGRDQEYLLVLVLDTRNRLIRPPLEVYHGSLNTSLIRVGEVFRQAIKDNAAGIIVAHNHPSGDPSPSADDVSVTRALRDAGALLDIALLDHIVIGRDG
jgi:DNA repair protein RadC